MSGTAEDLKLRMALVTEEILARTPENNPEPTLDRVAEVMDLMGSPQQTFGVIHITGTNGKTSTARMIETMLAEMGLNTGRFTSPHLHDLRERIAIGGESITHERFLAAYDDVLPFVRIVDEKSVADGGPKLTYFEILVCVAYAAFADTPVDVAVVEVGLGGVWDATNVADGLVSVLTPISIDHTRLLGNTVESIATEKVGIIKPDSVVVTGVQTHEVMEIIAAETEEKDASLQAEGVAFGVLEREVAVGGQVLSLRGLAGDYTDLFMPLYGAHQASNAAIAVAAVEAFVGGGEQRLTDEVIRSAFANFSSPGRLEIVRRSPTVLVDAAHNPAGVEALVEAVRESFMFGRLVGVIGVLAEKDAESMIALLEPVLDHIVLTRTTSPRAVSPQRLGEIALGYFGEDRISVIRDLPDALDLAAGMADDGGMSGAVLATGSVVTAAEVRMLLGQSAT